MKKALSSAAHSILEFLLPQRERSLSLARVSPGELLAHSSPAWLENHGIEAPGIFYLFPYRDPLVGEMIRSLKYHRNRPVAAICAAALHDVLVEAFSDVALFDNLSDLLLVPMPISRAKRALRGFNQARLLAEELLAIDGGGSFSLAPEDLLIRAGAGKAQALTRNRNERLANSHGTFRVLQTSLLADRTVILLDDVVTTGATMHDASRALLAAGARNVVGVALAH